MALEPACRRGRSTGLARGAPTNRRPRATVSCAIAPPPRGLQGSPSELFAGAGVAGGGPEAPAGVSRRSGGSSARSRLMTLECSQDSTGEPASGDT